jgi:hypothetical protein
MDAEVVHVVLFRWKAGVTAEQIEEVRLRLTGLRKAIPGILDLTRGQSFTDRAETYQFALVARFASRRALAEHLPHPAHRAVVADVISPLRESSLALDYFAG